MLRAGLYARVSTLDQQTLPLQIRDLRENDSKRGWTVVEECKEVGSGGDARAIRQWLMDSARRREIDIVLVWRLDRWGRSVAELFATWQELTALGIGFVSVTEVLDLTTPAGRAMAGLLSVFAECERVWRMGACRENALDGRQRLFKMQPQSAHYFGRVSANPRLPGGLGSAEHRFGGYWNKKLPELERHTQACRKDTKKLTYFFQGRDFRLTDVGGEFNLAARLRSA